jgi:hypothetical protein
MTDDLEDRIRRSWRPDTPAAVDAEDLLGKVNAGARRRRTRTGVLRGTAAVALIAAGAALWNQADRFERGGGTPQVAQSSPTTRHSTPIDIGFTPLSLTATGTNNQWVLGTTGCGASRCLFIRHLDKAGQVTAVPTPPSQVAVAGATRETVSGLRFAGTGGVNGWAFGGALWSTHDYGRSWNQPSLPVAGQVTTLEAWGEDVYASAQHGREATLVRSPVAGDEWTTVNTGTTLSRITSIGVSADLAAVAGVDRQQRAVVLTKTASSPWTRTSACAGATSAKVSTAQDALWVLCRHGERAAAVVSSDGGRTLAAVRGSFSWDTEIAGRTAATAVVAGTGGVREVSTSQPPQLVSDVPGLDGGSAHVTYAGFTNPDDGYLISLDGGLVRTTDGGRTWSAVSLGN